MDATMSEVGKAADDKQRLAAPELRELVVKMVRRKVPESDVDDVVQTVLVDALSAKAMPDGDEDLRRWLAGVTRHKVADYHRRGGRSQQVALPDQLEGEADPLSAREWADWADKQTEGDPDEQRTLDWMAREGAGEKLAHIADEEELPATQVRQRVSRLRRTMRQRWAKELAAVAAVVLLALIAHRMLRDDRPVAEPIVPEPLPAEPDPRLKHARELRAEAMRQCDDQQWQPCLDRLDQALRLDPVGEQLPEVAAARSRARKALEEQQQQPAPSASSSASAVPTASASAPPPKAPRKPSPKEVMRYRQQMDNKRRKSNVMDEFDLKSNKLPPAPPPPPQQVAPPAPNPQQAVPQQQMVPQQNAPPPQQQMKKKK
jgi:RNA polymerase sigma factor (sigma-70 family)